MRNLNNRLANSGVNVGLLKYSEPSQLLYRVSFVLECWFASFIKCWYAFSFMLACTSSFNFISTVRQGIKSEAQFLHVFYDLGIEVTSATILLVSNQNLFPAFHHMKA